MAKNISRVRIKAPVQRVWETITRPELVKLWLYGSDLVTSWEIGAEIRFRTEWDGKLFEQWGRVLEFNPYTLVKYSLFAPRPGLDDKPENYFKMIYMLRAQGQETDLEIIQEDDRPNAIQEPVQGEENPVLIQLKKVAEIEDSHLSWVIGH